MAVQIAHMAEALATAAAQTAHIVAGLAEEARTSGCSSVFQKLEEGLHSLEEGLHSVEEGLHGFEEGLHGFEERLLQSWNQF